MEFLSASAVAGAGRLAGAGAGRVQQGGVGGQARRRWRRRAEGRRPCRSRWPWRGPTPWWTPSSPPARSRRCSRSSCARTSRGASPQILVREGAVRGAGHAALQGGRRRAQGRRWRGPRPTATWPASRWRAPGTCWRRRPRRQSELERAEATARSNEAQLELLKVRLARTLVRAPVRRRRRPAVREPGRLRDDRHPAGRRCRPSRRSGPSFQVPERYADQLKRGPAGDLPRGGAPGTGVHRPGGLRGPGGAASRPDHHWSRRWCRIPSGSCRPACSSRLGSRRRCARAPSSFRRTRSSRSRASTFVWVVGRQGDAPPGGARRAHAGLRRGAERRRAAASRWWSAARSGWREGAPVAPKVVERDAGACARRELSTCACPCSSPGHRPPAFTLTGRRRGERSRSRTSRGRT